MPAERGAFPCSVHPSHKGGRCRGDLECAVRAVAILGSHDARSARLYLPTSALLGHACRYSTSGRCTASWPIVGVGLPDEVHATTTRRSSRAVSIGTWSVVLV